MVTLVIQRWLYIWYLIIYWFPAVRVLVTCVTHLLHWLTSYWLYWAYLSLIISLLVNWFKGTLSSICFVPFPYRKAAGWDMVSKVIPYPLSLQCDP